MCVNQISESSGEDKNKELPLLSNNSTVEITLNTLGNSSNESDFLYLKDGYATEYHIKISAICNAQGQLNGKECKIKINAHFSDNSSATYYVKFPIIEVGLES